MQSGLSALQVLRKTRVKFLLLAQMYVEKIRPALNLSSKTPIASDASVSLKKSWWGALLVITEKNASFRNKPRLQVERSRSTDEASKSF